MSKPKITLDPEHKLDPNFEPNLYYPYKKELLPIIKDWVNNEFGDALETPAIGASYINQVLAENLTDYLTGLILCEVEEIRPRSLLTAGDKLAEAGAEMEKTLNMIYGDPPESKPEGYPPEETYAAAVKSVLDWCEKWESWHKAKEQADE